MYLSYSSLKSLSFLVSFPNPLASGTSRLEVAVGSWQLGNLTTASRHHFGLIRQKYNKQKPTCDHVLLGNNDDFSFLGLLRFFLKALLCFITQDVKFWKCCSVQINKRQILRMAYLNRSPVQAGELESRKVSGRNAGADSISILCYKPKSQHLCKSGAIG